MKRFILPIVLSLWVWSTVWANPVDYSLAQAAASRFFEVQINADLQRGMPELAYAGRDGSFYVFNTGADGFVIIAGDDAYRPVIGYSDESSFDAQNIPPALVDYLEGVSESILRLRSRGNAVATPLVAAEWESVLNQGRLISRFGGREKVYFCQTKWDQSYPYNYCCPEDPDGSGGHTYVGCLATAMAQLMRFWAMPTQGIGSHCYVHEDYGEICADFGATTYDWDHMPNTLNEDSPEEEKLAVGTLGFHCGVTIDMGYGPDGSGGASGPIPGVMHQYFNYSDAIIQLRRDDFETETWKRMVREQFDMGWPMYYGGCQDDGCHAFVCDGYDDFDMFHFNLGWGGGSNGWYLIDEAPYTHPADAMFNFVPAEVYDQTPQTPTDFSVEVPINTELRTVLHWVNPTTTLDNTPIAAIDQIVVMRNNQILQVLTGMAPGEAVEIEDTDVPYYDVYEYAVYAVANGRGGKHAYALDVTVGPTCQWKVVMSSTNYHGWEGGYISVYNNAGHEVGQCTLTSSAPEIANLSLPLGFVNFSWSSPETPCPVNFKIKDPNNQEFYSFNGSSEDLEEGVFLNINNGCGNSQLCSVPQNLVASADDDLALLTWDAAEDEGFGYNVYRDGQLCRMIPAGSGTSYLDEQASFGGHCYQLTVLCEGGESEMMSNESCATTGPYYPPRDLDYELTDNFKIRLKWEPPIQTEGLTYYSLYRHKGNGEYQRIKLIASNAVTYVDNSASQEGHYYYRLYAFYKVPNCLSAPANRKYQPNVFELHAYYSPTGLVEEGCSVRVYPNPSQGTIKVEGPALNRVTVYNTMGQCVLDQPLSGESFEWNDMPQGLFLMQIDTENGVFYTKIVSL